MTSADLLVERGAQRLHQLAGRAAARGDGVGAWLSEELEADAAFLRKLKPSLIAARVRAERTNGAAPTEPPPAAAAPPPPPPQPKPQTQKRPSNGKGVSPWLIVGAALVTGVVVAKVLDWRGHAHPRD